MGHEFDRIRPIGGLDFDSENRAVQPGDYRYAVNLRNIITDAELAGTATNVKGNTKVTKYTLPYNGSTTLPAGENITIGAFEDERNNTCIFMNWNSRGQHQILRWYRNKTDINNPYGEVQQIIQFDFGWTRDERITSASIVYGTSTGDSASNGQGDLFYWTDSVEPRKIDLDKGNICGKHKSWQIFGGQSNMFAVGGYFQLTLRTITNAIIVSTNIAVLPKNSNAEAYAFLAAEINANPLYNTKIHAEACDCHLTITEIGTDSFFYNLAGFSLYLIPENWYGSTLIDTFFSVGKSPSLTAPFLEYKKDSTYKPNYVTGKVFQSRLGCDFDNLERSTLGVWSQIPINNLQCTGVDNPLYNYIDINFNNDNLINPLILVILKEVRVIVRELNTGSDKEVIRLKPCEYIDFVNGTFIAHYKFYNNILSTTVDPVEAALEATALPIKAGAQIVIKDRNVYGDITEGYDAPQCPEAEFKVVVEDTPQPKGVTVTALIRVFNPAMDNNANFPDETVEPNILERRSAICYDTTMAVNPGDTVYPYFGGSHYQSNAIEINSDWAYKKKRQLLPEAGWAGYLAGTNMYGISKQIQRENVSQRTDGSIDVSDTFNKDLLKKLYTNFSNDYTKNQYDVYSVLKIENVPPGEYVLRLADHRCSYGDKLGLGWMYDLNSGTSWQQTSTFVWGVNDTPIGGGYKYDYEIRFTVGNTDVYVGDFLVSDLAIDLTGFYTGQTGIAPSISGYVIDDLGNTDVNGLSDKGVRVELSYVESRVQNTPIKDYLKKITDHNGFYFIYVLPAGIDYTNQVNVQQVNGWIHTTNTQYYGDINGASALELLFNKTINNTFPQNPIPSHLEIIVPTDTPNARQLASTFVEGNLLNTNNEPIPSANIVYTHGRVGLTTADGSYQILAWGNMRINMNNRITDSLIYNVSYACQPNYLNGQDVLVLITAFGNTGYNPTNPLVLADFVVGELSTPEIKSLKRGGKYIIGGRFLDSIGRFCSVFSLSELYIPHETEDLGNFPYCVDNNGNPFPPNTYLGGKVYIKWTLPATFTAPSYASYFSFMRTKNLIYSPNYLQWAVNSVTYLSRIATDTTPEVQTSFQNGDATAIKLSITNIVDYKLINNSSDISYSYAPNDRVRLLYDSALNLIEGLQDFEVTSYSASTQELYIKPNNFDKEIKTGTVIEIFNNKTVESEDEQLFYEVGEQLVCTNPGDITNDFPYRSGTFTNGDTYWRGRAVPINDSLNNIHTTYNLLVEDASKSDFYPSQAQDIGRVGIIDPALKQLRLLGLMRHSDQFVPSTAINGLSMFQPLNRKELDRVYGAIQRFIYTENKLVAIMQYREISNYIGMVTLRDASSQDGPVSTSSDFFGTEYVHSKQLGTEFKASVVCQGSRIYGLRNAMANAWRFGSAGDTQGGTEAVISDVRAINYFIGLRNSGITDAISGYDRYHEEYILTVKRVVSKNLEVITANYVVPNKVDLVFNYGNIAPAIGTVLTIQYNQNGVPANTVGTVISVVNANGSYQVTVRTAKEIDQYVFKSVVVKLTYTSPETIAWNEAAQRWSTFYSFAPECYCSIGSDFISFVGGQLWVHNTNNVANNFYGVQYKMNLTPVFNGLQVRSGFQPSTAISPEFVKVWNACTLQTLQDNNGNDWSAPNITNDRGQKSRLVKGSWRKLEEHWYAAFKRDLTDVTVTNPILNGRNLRSTSLVVELENDYTGLVRLYSWDANWTLSERTSK